MRYIAYLFLLFPILVSAQTFKYIGLEDGLSNRRIFNIQKDMQGYMWFLTNEGLDRYNGKDIKHYKLNKEENIIIYSPVHPGWLYTTSEGGLWVIGKKGRVYQYDTDHDEFELKFKLPDSSNTVNYGFMDRKENIWLCSKDSISLYNIKDRNTIQLLNPMQNTITAIEQIDDDHFFIATEMGIRYLKLENNKLEIIPVETLDEFHAQVSVLHYNSRLQRLFIGSFERGIFVYDMPTQEIIRPEADLCDVNIARIIPLNDTELLIATEGMGVYKINVDSCVLDHYIIANYKSYNEMNGNNISDVFVDEVKRVWLANYPTGITIIDPRYKNYHWMKHSMGNGQSLINDQVHAVIEDSDGDLWFGTSNGISLYNSKTKEWHSFLSSFDQHLKDKNHIFTTLCEVSPDVIWAGGYTSGIYKINKNTLSVEYFSPYLLSHANMRPDKYIRDIVKDSKGYVWSGGYYNLKCFDPQTNDVRLYPGVNSITAIAEKDDHHMWIGTGTGLYTLNKDSGEYQYLALNVEAAYINSLYQSDNGRLYIGTNGAGVIIYDIKNNAFEHYYTDNSALISNRIFTILPEVDGRVMMSTENGITCFFTKTKTFRNWTRGEGLLPAYYNAASGTLRKDKSFVFGSTNGAIEISKDMDFPEFKYTAMIFSDFRISYTPVYPGDDKSPLKKNINDTDVLTLKYAQSSFSFKVSTINYDSPGNTLFTWKLEGYYDEWTQPGAGNVIRFTNLPSGHYKLLVRAISREEHNVIFEERTMEIIVERPLLASWWAILFYIFLAVWGALFICRNINLRKQKRISDEKTQFFINTAHDIRTPLTMIKAPLDELLTGENLSDKGKGHAMAALRSVDSLLHLATNLINFEKADVYSSELHISEYELNTYMKEICTTFSAYTEIKHVTMTYDSNFTFQNVWFDREKMDSILKNILFNALKYTPEHGKVSISVTNNKDSWMLVVKDTGIGIPHKEQRMMFKLHFRASNAINSIVSGSGIGLVLVGRCVELHGGKILIDSVEKEGTTVTIVIPKNIKKFKKKYKKVSPQKLVAETFNMFVQSKPEEKAEVEPDVQKRRILIVDDNDDLRNFLVNTLSPSYNVQSCSNGKEAMIIVKEFWPDLILSDIMMPEMRGDEMCKAIKSNIETSHIPVILLSALGDEQDILSGLETGADDYISKPFNLRVLRASIGSILANRDLLRSKYGSLEMDADIIMPIPKCNNSLDWQFMSKVRKSVEDNISNTEFKVDMFSQVNNMSRTSFFCKLKALTELTPSGYLKTFRLRRAMKLLKEGEHSIIEIAEMCGFSSDKYFREVFKKYLKMSPTQFAKEGDINAPIHMDEDPQETAEYMSSQEEAAKNSD